MNSAYLLLRALLIVLWPPVACASVSVTLQTTISTIDLGVWAIVFALCTMGGLTSLLHRLKTDTPPNMTLYVAAHMLMAWFSGALGFFALEAAEVTDLIEIPLIGIIAYSGARLLDVFSERLAVALDKYLAKLFS